MPGGQAAGQASEVPPAAWSVCSLNAISAAKSAKRWAYRSFGWSELQIRDRAP